jgi:alkyl hydroperoxide reductase subunit AhpC
MPDQDIKELSSEQYKGKWLVLFSYPLDFTFVCPTEIWAFSEASGKFKEIGCEVLGMSVDSVYSHIGWMNMAKKEGGLGAVSIPLLGDLGGKVSQKFGFYGSEAGHCIRGTAIVNPEGVLMHMSQNEPSVGRNVDETLRLVKAYQFAASHGEVCPARWEEGQPTIKPDPKASKAFFGRK